MARKAVVKKKAAVEAPATSAERRTCRYMTKGVLQVYGVCEAGSETVRVTVTKYRNKTRTWSTKDKTLEEFKALREWCESKNMECHFNQF